MEFKLNSIRDQVSKEKAKEQRVESLTKVSPVPGLSLGSVPYFLRVRSRLRWWQQHATDPEVLRLIVQGVGYDWKEPSLKVGPCVRAQDPVQVARATEILEEYESVGAVCRLQPGFQPRCLLPWFVVSKEEDGREKQRFITDCRVLNQFLRPNHFK